MECNYYITDDLKALYHGYMHNNIIFIFMNNSQLTDPQLPIYHID